MKKLGLMPMIAAAMLVSTALSYAQTPASPAAEQPRETQPAATGNNSGTQPEHKGSAGWTGGAKDQPSQDKDLEAKTGTTGQGSSDAAARDAEAAKDQPVMASGLDLKGPPIQFPPSKTPE